MSLACPTIIANYSPGLCQAVDYYCERTSASFDAEPLNTISNAAFLVAAVAAWRLQHRQPSAAAKAWIAALAIIIGIVGIGSFLFHTIATEWANWADVIPILVFMLSYCWLVLGLFFGWRWWLKMLAVAVLVGATVRLSLKDFDHILWGGAMYLPTVALLVVFAVAMVAREPGAGRAFVGATMLFLISLTARTVDLPLCDRFPLGTHYVWHILNATVLYLLVRIAAVHAAGCAQSEGAAAQRSRRVPVG